MFHFTSSHSATITSIFFCWLRTVRVKVICDQNCRFYSRNCAKGEFFQKLHPLEKATFYLQNGNTFSVGAEVSPFLFSTQKNEHAALPDCCNSCFQGGTTNSMSWTDSGHMNLYHSEYGLKEVLYIVASKIAFLVDLRILERSIQNWTTIENTSKLFVFTTSRILQTCLGTSA